jgi:hypothetical protein
MVKSQMRPQQIWPMKPDETENNNSEETKMNNMTQRIYHLLRLYEPTNPTLSWQQDQDITSTA